MKSCFNTGLSVAGSFFMGELKFPPSMDDKGSAMIQIQTEILLTSLSGHRMLFGDWKTAYALVSRLFVDVQYRYSKVGKVQIVQGFHGVIAEMELV